MEEKKEKKETCSPEDGFLVRAVHPPEEGKENQREDDQGGGELGGDGRGGEENGQEEGKSGRGGEGSAAGGVGH